MQSFEQKLADLGLRLPQAPAAVGSYVPVLQTGQLVITSGQLPTNQDGLAFAGKLGQDLEIEQGAEAAQLCCLNALAQIKTITGSLDNVKRIIRVEGFVHCTSEFTDHPKVLNGASDLLVQIFGEAGKHTRFAIGTNQLPLNAAVEVGIWAEI